MIWGLQIFPPKGSSRTQRQQTQLFKLKNVNTVDKDLPGYKQWNEWKVMI